MAINWQKYYEKQKITPVKPVVDKYSWMKTLGFSEPYVQEQTDKLATRIRREVVHELALRKSEDYGVLATPRTKQFSAMNYKKPEWVYTDMNGNEIPIPKEKDIYGKEVDSSTIKPMSGLETKIESFDRGMKDVEVGLLTAADTALAWVDAIVNPLDNADIKKIFSNEETRKSIQAEIQMRKSWRDDGQGTYTGQSPTLKQEYEQGYAKQTYAGKIISDTLRGLPSQALLLAGGFGQSLYAIYSMGASIDQYVKGEDPWYEEYGRAAINAGLDIATEYMFDGFKSIYTSMMKRAAKNSVELAGKIAAKEAEKLAKHGMKPFVPKVKNFLVATAKSMLEEGTEEVVSYVGTSLLDWGLRNAVDSKDKKLDFNVGDMVSAGLVGSLSAAILSFPPAWKYHKDLKEVKQYARTVAEILDMDIRDVTNDVVESYIKSAVAAAKAMGLDDTQSIDKANQIYSENQEPDAVDYEDLIIGKQLNDIIADPQLSKDVWLNGPSGRTWIRASLNRVMRRANARWYETALRNHLRKNGSDAKAVNPADVVKSAAIDMLKDYVNSNIEKWRRLFAGNPAKLKKLDEVDARLDRVGIEEESGNPEYVSEILEDFAQDADTIDETGELKTHIEGTASILRSDVVPDSIEVAANVAVVEAQGQQEIPTQAVDIDAWIRDARAKILRVIGSGNAKRIKRLRKELEASTVIDDATKESILEFFDEKVLEYQRRDEEYLEKYNPIVDSFVVDSIESARKAEELIDEMKERRNDIPDGILFVPIDKLRDKVSDFKRKSLNEKKEREQTTESTEKKSEPDRKEEVGDSTRQQEEQPINEKDKTEFEDSRKARISQLAEKVKKIASVIEEVDVALKSLSPAEVKENPDNPVRLKERRAELKKRLESIADEVKAIKTKEYVEGFRFQLEETQKIEETEAKPVRSPELLAYQKAQKAARDYIDSTKEEFDTANEKRKAEIAKKRAELAGVVKAAEDAWSQSNEAKKNKAAQDTNKAEDMATRAGLDPRIVNDIQALREDAKAYKSQYEILTKEIDELSTKMADLVIDADKQEKDGHQKKAEWMRDSAAKIEKDIASKKKNRDAIIKKNNIAMKRIKWLAKQPANPIRMKRTLVSDKVEFVDANDMKKVAQTSARTSELADVASRLAASSIFPAGDEPHAFSLFEVEHQYGELFQKVKDTFGTEVVVVSSTDAQLNGSYYAFFDGEKIYMNGSIKDAPASVVFHEIMHEMQQIAPEIYDTLREYISQYLCDSVTGPKPLIVEYIERELAVSKPKTVDLSKSPQKSEEIYKAIDEYIGDMVMYLAQHDPKFFDKITYKHRSVSEAIQSGIGKFLSFLESPMAQKWLKFTTKLFNPFTSLKVVEHRIIKALQAYSYIKTIKPRASELEVATRKQIVSEAANYAERTLLASGKTQAEVDAIMLGVEFWESAPEAQDVIDKIEKTFKVRIVAINSNSEYINDNLSWAGFNTVYGFSPLLGMNRESYSVVRYNSSSRDMISTVIHEVIHSVHNYNQNANNRLMSQFLDTANNAYQYEEFEKAIRGNPLYASMPDNAIESEFLAYFIEELLIDTPALFDAILSMDSEVASLIADSMSAYGGDVVVPRKTGITQFIDINKFDDMKNIRPAISRYLTSFMSRRKTTPTVYSSVAQIPQSKHVTAFVPESTSKEVRFKRVPLPEGKNHRVVLGGAQYFSKHLTTKMLENYPAVKLETQADIDSVDAFIDKAAAFTDEKVAEEFNRLLGKLKTNQTAANRKRILHLLLSLAIVDNEREVKAMVKTKGVQNSGRRVHQFIRNMVGANLENLSPSMRTRLLERHAKGDFVMDYMMASNEKAWMDSESIDENEVLSKLEETEDIMSDAEAIKIVRAIKRMMDSKQFKDNERATDLMGIMARKLTKAGQFTQAMTMAYNMLFPQMKVIKEFERENYGGNKSKVDDEMRDNSGRVDSAVKQIEIDVAKDLDNIQHGDDIFPVQRNELTVEEIKRILASRKKKFETLMKEAWRAYRKLTDDQIKADWLEQEKIRRLEEDEAIQWTEKMVDKLEKEILSTWEKNSASIIKKVRDQEARDWVKYYREQNAVELEALKTWDELNDAERLEELIYKWFHPEAIIEGEKPEKPPKEFDMDKVEEILKYIQEKFPMPNRKQKKKSNPYEAVAFLVKNKVAFTALFDEAQQVAYDRYKIDKAEFARMFSYLQSEMQPVIRTARLDAIIKDALQANGFTIEQLIRDYRMGRTAMEQSFVSYVMKKTGLVADDAIYLTNAIRNRMKVVMAERARKFVRNAVGVSGAKSEDQMIKMFLDVVEYGALNDDAYRKLFAQKVGVPVITDEHIKLIESTMKRVAMLDSDKDWREISRLMDNMYEQLSESIPMKMIEKLATLRAMQMLFSPKSWMKNYLGNMMRIPLDNTAYSLQGLLERWLQKDSSKWTSTAKSGVHLRAGSFKEGFARTTFDKLDSRAMEAIEHFERYGKPSIAKTAKFELKGRLGKNKKIFRGKDVVSTSMQNAVDFPFKVLEWGDAPVVKYAYLSAMMRFMNSRGLEHVTPEAADYALKTALDATYRIQLESTRIIGMIKGSSPIASLIVSTIQPFVNTGFNIVKVGYEYGPVSFVDALVRYAYKKGVAKKHGINAPPWDDTLLRKLSRGILGTLLMAVGYIAGLLGYATGAAPTGSDDDKKLWKLLNIKPYSIMIGSKYISFDWMNPASMPFMMGATYAQNNVGATDAMKHWNSIKETFNAFVRSTMYGNMEQTMGYTEPADILFDKLFKSLVFQFSGSILLNIVKSASPYIMASYSPEGSSKILMDLAVRLDIQGIRQGDYPEKIDMFGDPVKKAQIFPKTGFFGRLLSSMASPFTMGERDISPRAKMIMDVYKSARDMGANDASYALPSIEEGTVNKRVMTSKEYAKYNMTRGQYIKAEVDKLISDPTFMALPDYSATEVSKFAYLKKIYARATKVAEAEYNLEHPLE